MRAQTVDFVVLHPEGRLERGQFPRSKAPRDVLAKLIPNMTSQGFGRLHTWFSANAAGQPANPLADTVTRGMGYRSRCGWHGRVALTMADDDGRFPPLLPDALASIEELAATAPAAA